MSRNFRPLMLSALALTVACTGEIPTGTGSPEIRANKYGSVLARPAGGKCTTTFTQTDFQYPIATVDIQGVCTLKHLEHATFSAIQTINVETGELNNATTYTAQNGDLLYSTFVGTASPPPDVVFQGTETYNGGTGLFAAATGSSFVQGRVTGVGDGGGTGLFHSKGTITF